MFNLIIFLVILVYGAEATDNGRTEIGFEVHHDIENRKLTLNCDHSNDEPLKEYTVREGEDLGLSMTFNSFFNHFTCQDNIKHKVFFTYENTIEKKNKIVFKAQKRMGTIWNCTMLAKKDNPKYDLVQYKNGSYAAAHCFMKIHVRQTNSPQTILVNNMVLPSISTDMLEQHVDFIAEYQYADGDVVDVTCANFLNEESLLTMDYELGGTMSDKSIMKELSAQQSIGFVTKLNSGHNNSYMICTNTEPNDYTKAMVRFVKRTKFSIITVKINGLNIRPEPINDIQTNHYHIEYKYESHQLINMICEVERTDVNLSVTDDDFVRPRSEVSSYKRTELTKKQIVMDFSLSSPDDRNLVCITEYANGTNAELVSIRFTASNSSIEQFQLHMKLLSNGAMLELYSDTKLKVIIYEFDDGATLNLTCGTLQRLQPGPVVYLELKDSECRTNGCNVSKTIHVTGKDNNTEIVCYLKEDGDPANASQADIVHKEIRVVLRERVEERSLLDSDRFFSFHSSPNLSILSVWPTAESRSPDRVSVPPAGSPSNAASSSTRSPLQGINLINYLITFNKINESILTYIILCITFHRFN